MELRSIRRTSFACALFASSISAARAADLYWDTNGASAGIGNNGSSTWTTDPGKTVWSATSVGNTTPTFWTNNDDAFFTGTAGNVALSGNVIARSMTVTIDAYQFSGSNLTLSTSSNGAVSTSAPDTPSSISVAAGITATFKNAFVGNMDLNVVGDGTTVLAHANTFSGNISAIRGTLQLNDDNALGNPANILVPYSESIIQTDAAIHSFPQSLLLNSSFLPSPSFTFSGPGISFLGNTTLTSGNLFIAVTPNSSLTLAGAVSGPGLFLKEGTGAVAFSGTSPNTFSAGLVLDFGTVQLNKTPNTQAVAGPITIGHGTLSLLAPNQIADTSDLTISTGSIFDMSGNSEAVRSMAGSGAVNLGNATLTLLPATDTTFSGTFFPANGVVAKNGAGTFNLAGNALGTIGSVSNFGGPLTFANGSLALTATGATGFGGTSSFFVENGACVTIQQGFALTTYATPAVHGFGSVLVDGATTQWNNLDAIGVPADIRIGYAGASSLLIVQNGAHVSSQSYISIGSHNFLPNIGIGTVYVLSGATLTATLGLRMDANCTLLVDRSTAIVGGLTSIGTSTPSIFLTDPSPTVSALTIANGTSNSTFNGNIADTGSGSGGITVNNNITLTGQNSYTGFTRINAGLLTEIGGNNNSPFIVSGTGQFFANGVALTLLNGTGGITANPGASATYLNSTLNGGYLAGAGVHFIEGGTLTNTNIQSGASAFIFASAAFNNVTLDGTLFSDDFLRWTGGSVSTTGRWTIDHACIATSISSNGVITIGSQLTINGTGLVLGAGSRTNVGSPVLSGSAISGNILTLNGGRLENFGTVDVDLFVNSGGLAEGTGVYTYVTVTSGGQVFFSSSQVLNTLAINGGAVTISAGTIKAGGYSLGGSANAWTGQLELGGNKLVIDAAPGGKNQLLATLQNQIVYGQSHNAGITDSAPLPPNTALAIIDNASLATPLTTFGGAALDINSFFIAPELLGDANIDGAVNLSDLSTLLNNFGAATNEWTSGKFDNATTIDLTDLSFVLNNFGLTYSAPAAATITPTPEPFTLSLLAPAATALLLRRRNRSNRRAIFC